MRIIRQRSLRGPEVLELATVDRPESAATELLIKVAAAGVNPVDWKTRSRGECSARRRSPGGRGRRVEELGFGVTRFAAGGSRLRNA